MNKRKLKKEIEEEIIIQKIRNDTHHLFYKIHSIPSKESGELNQALNELIVFCYQAGYKKGADEK